MNAQQIAPVVHAAIRAFQKENGQQPAPPWEEAAWEKESTIAAVIACMDDPTPGQEHKRWMNERLAAGWVYGPVKDKDAKTNPWLVDFEKLPETEKAKDTIIIALAQALKDVS